MSTSCVQFRRAWVEGRTEKDSHVHRAEKVCPSDIQGGTVSRRGWDPKMGIRSQSGRQQDDISSVVGQETQEHCLLPQPSLSSQDP